VVAATASVVNSSLRELMDSIFALCERLRRCDRPFTADEYDRLALLLPTMLSAAEDLCRAAHASGPENLPTQYAELADSIVKTKEHVRELLQCVRPEIPEHADAIAAIRRASAFRRNT